MFKRKRISVVAAYIYRVPLHSVTPFLSPQVSSPTESVFHGGCSGRSLDPPARPSPLESVFESDFL